jgi:hypothetical protein
MAITKLDALEVIAFVSDGVVENKGTAFPRVHVGKNAWAEVQIPRFADPPPVAVDVCSDASIEVARVEAARLAGALERVGWTVHVPRIDEI